jgi:hypothetical protein
LLIKEDGLSLSGPPTKLPKITVNAAEAAAAHAKATSVPDAGGSVCFKYVHYIVVMIASDG